MTTTPQIGRNIWNQEIVRGKHSIETIRRSLQRMIEDPGPRETAQLITSAALALTTLQSVINELETIGRNAKSTGSLTE